MLSGQLKITCDHILIILSSISLHATAIDSKWTVTMTMTAKHLAALESSLQPEVVECLCIQYATLEQLPS